MDARDQRVGRQHEVFAGDRAHQRRVIAQAQARRPRQRGEIAGDEIGFAEARRHGKAQIRKGEPATGRGRRSVSAFGGWCRVKPNGAADDEWARTHFDSRRLSLDRLFPVKSESSLFDFPLLRHPVGDCAMILDKRRALGSAGFFCMTAAFSGGAWAAQVYPGCAEPGPTGKVWWVDPVNGKTPADGGNGSQTAPWNSLTGVIMDFFPPRLQPAAAVERPLHPRRWGQASLRCGPARRPAGPARRHDQADERQLWRHRRRRLRASGRQPEFRYGGGCAGTDAGVLDPVHPLDQQMGLRRHHSAKLVGTNRRKLLALVTVADQGAALPTSDIVLTNLKISSADAPMRLGPRLNGSPRRAVGIFAWGSAGNGTNGEPNTTCVSMVGNHIFNVRQGDLIMVNNSQIVAQRARPFRR